MAAYALSTGLRVEGFLAKGQPDAKVTAIAPWLGDEDSWDWSREIDCLLAIGDPRIRARAGTQVRAKGGRLASLVHPTALVVPSATIGEGAIVGPFAFVGPDARAGEGLVLNTYSSLGHDSAVGDYCTFSPYATINGNTELGHCVFLGSGAIVVPKVKVGGYSKLSAGAVATRDLPEGSLAYGNPAVGRVMFKP